MVLGDAAAPVLLAQWLMNMSGVMESTKPLSSVSLLLVEDDASLSHTLQEFFTDHGYHTQAADSNRQAWESIRSSRPDVCILDLNLPDGSGLDLLRKIAHHQLPVRVIVMTALPIAHLRPSHTDAHVTAWLTKPVSPQNLLAAVRGE